MSGLFKAVYEGDLARVQRLIREGADVTKRYNHGRTVLLIAASLNFRNSHVAILQWLLEEGGSSMTETTYSGLTVWNLLVIYGDTNAQGDTIALSSLLKIMVMLEDAPNSASSFLRRTPNSSGSPPGASSSERSCRRIWSSSGPQSSRSAPCPLCCRFSLPITPRSLRRTFGRTACASKLPERKTSEP